MNQLDALMQSHPLPTWRPVAWPVAVMVAVFLGWTHFAQLDEVTVATGEIVPQGKVRVIQHLEGGIVESISVREGDLVQEGAVLLQLALGVGNVNREELQVRLDAQLLIKARLEAQATNTPLRFPEEVARRQSNLANAQRQQYEERRREHEAAIRVLDNQVRQRELEVQELDTKLKATDRNLALARERFQMSTQLLAQGLTPRIEHLQLEAEVQSLEGQAEGFRASIPRARTGAQEFRERLAEERSKFTRATREELAEAEQAIARITQLLNEATAQRGRAEIRSPVDGVVKNLRSNTIGGVVKPGDPIMEIVPTAENLVVDVRLDPVDRGYVTEGQPARVKVSAYDFVRYGALDGRVSLVAPDASQDEEGNPYFRVVVGLQKAYLGEREGQLPITPGMQATVDIHTGTKSVLDYLLKPVLKMRDEAFRER